MSRTQTQLSTPHIVREHATTGQNTIPNTPHTINNDCRLETVACFEH